MLIYIISRSCMQAGSLQFPAAARNSHLIPRSESKLTVCVRIITVTSCIHIANKGLCHTYAALMAQPLPHIMWFILTQASIAHAVHGDECKILQKANNPLQIKLRVSLVTWCNILVHLRTHFHTLPFPSKPEWHTQMEYPFLNTPELHNTSFNMYCTF